jgi:hypothetical protein
LATEAGEAAGLPAKVASPDPVQPERRAAEVVTLDKFRKR